MQSVSWGQKRGLTAPVAPGVWRMSRWLGLGLVALLVGCLDFGQVEQGRVVAFDPQARTLLLVRDVSKTGGRTDYSGIPPVQYSLPEDPAEVGPLPEVGNLLNVDAKGGTLTLFEPATQSIRTVSAQVVSLQEEIGPKHPLVYDRSEKKALAFPQLDREKGTLTLYLKPQKQLVTFALTDELKALPDAAWVLGDEVRVYFKQPPATLRYMNVSKTDIFSK